ncbi:hypothetical protein HNQ74_000083 [Bartonella doshiae]|uniref:Uncharacterized protein n=2 Tax=Bartonella doshiae TaxID=33044 RepID=A0A380ZGJ0_BARDO|nr:hypothetical protein MCS_01022 [Bartonella doshiae NCTC 12862 = ATCC 700133]MBB6158677.1 hypothetical protein [Bartonella doshiae]SUV46027.1 Uncharacterised protein [Bartonella doshiae]
MITVVHLFYDINKKCKSSVLNKKSRKIAQNAMLSVSYTTALLNKKAICYFFFMTLTNA